MERPERCLPLQGSKTVRHLTDTGFHDTFVVMWEQRVITVMLAEQPHRSILQFSVNWQRIALLGTCEKFSRRERRHIMRHSYAQEHRLTMELPNTQGLTVYTTTVVNHLVGTLQALEPEGSSLQSLFA